MYPVYVNDHKFLGARVTWKWAELARIVTQLQNQPHVSQAYLFEVRFRPLLDRH